MAEDIDAEAKLGEIADRLSERVARGLQQRSLKGSTVRLKLRLADFTTFTRQTTLRSSVDDVETIGQVARQLLRREIAPSRRFRLVGVGVTNFQAAYQLELLPR